MIALTQTTNTEIFAFIAVLVFKLLSRRVLFINRKDNRNCEIVRYFLNEVRNSRVTISNYETELRKMTSHFEVLTQSPKLKSYNSSY